MTDRHRAWARALRDHCAAKPEAQEDHPWGDTVFKVKGKVFAFLGGGDTPAVTVKAPPEELDMLLGAPFIQRARYVGRYGWVTVRVEDEAGLELALALIDDSYGLVRARGRKRRAASGER
jgi:predicted DNA-binding protein (MmcQ/YjbR family)